MDLSNKGLAFLLVAAIVVSLGGTMLSLNRLNQLGFTANALTDTGETNFSLVSDVSIAFTVNSLNFGVGAVNASPDGVQHCILDSNNTAPSTYCISFGQVNSALIVENQGNVNVSLALRSNATAAQFIGGTNPGFNWSVTNNETGSCAGSLPQAAWSPISTSDTPVCTNFNYGDLDTLQIRVKMAIPENATKTQHKAQFTATATE